MSSNDPVAALPPIPVDLFISKKHPNLTRGELGFADSSGNLVFRLSRSDHPFKNSSSSPSPSPSPVKKTLLDSSGTPIISFYRYNNGTWKGFKGDGGDGDEKGLIFRVERTVSKLRRTELEVFVAGENSDVLGPDFLVVGCVFQKSCTIYRGDSIVAQTSLMYKLHQVYARRNRFRLTMFSGSVDQAFFAALVAVFLDGRK